MLFALALAFALCVPLVLCDFVVVDAALAMSNPPLHVNQTLG